MRTRAWLVALALTAGVVALLAWRAGSPASSPPSAVAQVAAPSEPRAEVAWSTTIRASVASSSVLELDAETVLRRLEPLSVTEKPRALALALEADARLPPSGVFAEARRALIVTLLVDLDRVSEARARARQFTVEYPASRYLPLVQGVTGVHPRPRPSQLRDARAPQ
jgi:hypothetical protein